MNYETMTDRELDALVAEKVMGWMCDGRNTALWRVEPDFARSKADWRPASKIADAFEVVEAMRERGWYFSCIVAKDWISAAFVLEEEGHDPKASEEFADTLPRAICIAALRALDA